MDRFRALEVFVAVAEEGSLAGAARSLGVSPPSVTRIIGELEEDIGVSLFTRTTRLVTLTDVGRSYLGDTRKLLTDFQTANDAASGAYSAPTGLLRITASTLFGQIYISPIILEFLDKFPNVQVDCLFLERVVNLMEEGIDIAIRLGNLQDSSMRAIKVGEVSWTVCGTDCYFKKHGMPQKPSDLADHKLICVGPVPSYLEWKFAKNEVARLKPRLVYSSVTASIEATKSGWGLTRALSYQVGPSLGSGELQTVLSEFEPERIPIHIVHTGGTRPPAKVRAFIDKAVETLRADPFLN